MLKLFHPAVFVTAGLFLLILLQRVPAQCLPWWAVTLILVALISARQDWWRIVRRLRYIFLALVILFAWQTPGTLIVPVLGGFSPTWDGLHAALEPALRLIAVVSVVAMMLRYLSAEDWVNSLYVLVNPLRLGGLDPERFAVRLRLVLDYVERRDLNWRTCLDGAAQEASAEKAVWLVHVLQPRDRCALLGLTVVLGWLLW